MNKIITTKYAKIGGDEPCYVIAEIGSNHNGNFDLACELIEKARDAGVNAVKFQTFKAKDHYSTKTPKISMYDESIYNIIESLEIDRSWHAKLAKICDNLRLDFLDSPCDREAVDLAQAVDMPIMKVASFDMVDHRLIDYISKTGKTVMFSTGMANMSEIEKAVKACKNNNNNDIIILQCTSLYPAPVHLSNLRAMRTLSLAFDCVVGYSDHTMGDHVPCASVAMGAKVIEKHYTLDRNLDGPDHIFAIEPNELKDMVSKIRDVESAMGDGYKNGPREEEEEMHEKVRRSIIANKDMHVGHIITEDDITIKRPGIGIHPEYFQILIGRKVIEPIEVDEPMNWGKI
jgi:sialic acid synthase SpsE